MAAIAQRSREEFAARVWTVIPEWNGGQPLPILTRAEEAHAWELIDAALKYGVGPIDTACQLLSDVYEGRN